MCVVAPEEEEDAKGHKKPAQKKKELKQDTTNHRKVRRREMPVVPPAGRLLQSAQSPDAQQAQQRPNQVQQQASVPARPAGQGKGAQIPFLTLGTGVGKGKGKQHFKSSKAAALAPHFQHPAKIAKPLSSSDKPKKKKKNNPLKKIREAQRQVKILFKMGPFDRLLRQMVDLGDLGHRKSYMWKKDAVFATAEILQSYLCNRAAQHGQASRHAGRVTTMAKDVAHITSVLGGSRQNMKYDALCD